MSDVAASAQVLAARFTNPLLTHSSGTSRPWALTVPPTHASGKPVEVAWYLASSARLPVGIPTPCRMVSLVVGEEKPVTSALALVVLPVLYRLH